MTRSLLPEISLNGGFPEPPAGEPVRVVSAVHAACGEQTRVRLPSSVPARAVRRMCCATCAQPFSADRIEELGVEGLQLSAEELAAAAVPAVEATPTPKRPAKAAAPAKDPEAAKPKRSLPAMPKLTKPKFSKPSLSLPKLDPEGPLWKLASLPLAAVAVVVALFLLQGGDDQGSPSAATTDAAESADLAPAVPAADVGSGADATAPAATPADDPAAPAASGETEFVSGSTFSLALPAGWQQGEASGGATFHATAPDDAADVTLWVKEDPKLEYPEFISQSLSQLQALTGSRPTIAERLPGPTAEETIVRLAADSPEGEPTYEVTLRVNGPYRYYLATTVQPGASAEVVEGVELIEGSFTPEAKG